MDDADIRWIQRFNNYRKAFSCLEEAVCLAKERRLSELEEQGLIQAFEFTHELAWNTMKDFLENHGSGTFFGSKDTTREAFKRGLIENGEAWMSMITRRNLTSHTYDESVASAIVKDICTEYYPEFLSLKSRFEILSRDEQS